MANRTKVLLVEDHDDTRKAMCLLLRHSGFDVVEAATVADGIDRLNGQAIALLDLHLPDGLGSEILAQIRKHSHPTSVAFVTAAYDAELLHHAAAEADAVFQKPTDYNEILNWIKQRVGGAQ